MWLADLIAPQRRLTLTLAMVLAVMGMVAWFTMPRQEDPTFPYRNGMLIIPFPGADALTVERLVLEPLEESLAEIPEVSKVNSVARADVAVVTIRLSDSVYETDPIWDDVRDQIAEAETDFPEEVLPWRLDDELTDLESVVVAVTGPDDPIALLKSAQALKDELLDLHRVSRVNIIADPGEQITVAIDDEVARRMALPPGQLAQRIAAQTSATPGGTVRQGGASVVIDPGSEVESIDAIAALPVSVGSGQSVPLASIAQVDYGPTSPVNEIMRLNGQPAVAVGVIPRPGIDVVRFGADVQDVIDEGVPGGATLTVLTSQPGRVEARLSDLGGSLLQGVGIVALVLMIAMGLRLGGVVALIVPLVTFSSLAIYAAAGGVLQQISIAGLVISLGLLVDNGIVISERVQYRVDRGQDPLQASRDTVAELAVPLLSATGTTVASFIPLLLSEGPTGDFTRAIPQMVILTLCVSLVAALTVTPTLAGMFFRRKDDAEAPTVDPRVLWLSRLPAQRPGAIAGAVLGLVVLSGVLAPFVKQQFFPGADRDQLVIELSLPEGSHLTETDAVARAVEAALMERADVDNVATFVGRSTPSFYYNLTRKPQSPQLAQILVDTRDAEDVAAILSWARDFVRQELPGTLYVGRALAQGPPLQAPVELRLYGEDLNAMWSVANEVHGLLRGVDGTADVRHDLSAGVPSVDVQPNDAALARYALDRRSLAVALLGQTRGVPAGSFRAGDDPVPIRVRSLAGEDTSLERLQTVDVWSPTAGPVPLMSLAEVELSYQPAAIRHRDGQRVVTVSAQLDGATFSEVLDQVRGPADALVAQRGLSMELGGEAEGSGEANTSIFLAAPLGGAMLIGFLLAQFRSFRKVLIVLMTVPLAATGVVPGLLLADQPFGFTSLLGVFALIGIVVNNAIILIDFIDTARQEGASVEDAAAQAVQVRLRPILLTTATTIAGLVPLLFSSSTLWPPLASALISGLAASTVLTLLAIPAAYILLFRPRTGPSAAPMVAMVTPAVALLLVANPGHAASLEEALMAAEANNHDLEMVEQLAEEAEAQVIRARSALMPKLVAQGSYTYNPVEIEFDPGASFGDVEFLMASDLEPIFAEFEDPALVEAVFEEVRADEAAQDTGLDIDPIVVRQQSYFDASASLVQPLVNMPALPQIRAAGANADAAGHDRDRTRHRIRAGVARAYYAAVVADEAVVLSDDRIANAEAHLKLAQRQNAVGAAARIAVVQAELDLTEARRQRAESAAQQVAARQTLSRLTGL
ncbi:MAG: efflux RND transporter permease subunit, partial [Myxococcota bacterium]